MIGCETAWKWAVACFAGDWSQQPTWPHSWQTRRWSQSCFPVARQSSQPQEEGVTPWISSRWVQVAMGSQVQSIRSNSGLNGGREARLRLPRPFGVGNVPIARGGDLRENNRADHV